MIGGYQPAYPAVALRPAGFWIRVLAYIIDSVLFGVLAGVLSGVTPTDTSCVGSPNQYFCNSTHPLSTSVSGLVAAVYFIALWTLWGRTLGMRILGLRIVRTDGSAVGIGTAILRYVGLIVSFLVCFVGVIWVAFDSQKRGWHDRIANTLVIHG